MNAVAKQTNYYTIEDIYNLPNGQRAELIDGKLYMMAAPGRIHQRIVMELSFRIREYIGRNGGDCEVYLSPFAVFLNANDRIYLEPDISIICDKNKLTDEGCKGAPDWIIEVVSPSSRPMDYNKKLFKYRTACVREYWIVNPMKKAVQTYVFEGEEDSNLFSFDEKIPVHIFDGLSIQISDLV